MEGRELFSLTPTVLARKMQILILATLPLEAQRGWARSKCVYRAPSSHVISPTGPMQLKTDRYFTTCLSVSPDFKNETSRARDSAGCSWIRVQESTGRDVTGRGEGGARSMRVENESAGVLRVKSLGKKY